MGHHKYIWLSIALYMNMFDMFVCFLKAISMIGKVSPLDFKKGRLCGILGFVIIVLAKIIGISAYISLNGNQIICSSDLKGAMALFGLREKEVCSPRMRPCAYVFSKGC